MTRQFKCDHLDFSTVQNPTTGSKVVFLLLFVQTCTAGSKPRHVLWQVEVSKQ